MQDNSDMFESGAYFDPNSVTHHQQLLTDHNNISNYHQIPNFSTIEPPEYHYHHHHLMNIEMDHQTHQQISWNHNFNDHILNENNDNNFVHTQTPPDLLNLFNLPKSSSSMLFSNPAHVYQNSGQIIPTQLLNSLSNGFNVSGFGEMDMEAGERSRLYHEGDAAFEFDAGIVKGRGRGKKDIKHFATEKHRRQQLNGKFAVLRSLIPNPTKKDDRASIIGDAIEYINKLKRDLEDLKVSVDRKRFNRSRMKKPKTEDDSYLDVESIYTMSNTGHDQQAYNGSSTSTMKSSWLQRKSKNIEIDVRIIDDEVTIKLVQQKGINCMLPVSRVLDELKLDVHHVAGGLVGGFYSYLFNNKICEGSSVYASAIANKLIEVVDKQYATITVTSS